jgi:hypothetical protein
MSRIVIAILIYHRHKPIDSIHLLGSQRRRNVFPLREHSAQGYNWATLFWGDINTGIWPSRFENVK